MFRFIWDFLVAIYNAAHDAFHPNDVNSFVLLTALIAIIAVSLYVRKSVGFFKAFGVLLLTLLIVSGGFAIHWIVGVILLVIIGLIFLSCVM